ncbi:hypothetical protein FIBSPDRAFT_320356 [Athelia psychrophila]|uniref:Uncharacterized protein n=1 Tax=Athelia psychrophila TaxID=1759441 RepID=A0A166QHP7_9AGAM|nr:hypothetical protein FIBSPDRAFT_320356 [Fibularhizoctonia sp. CBS 109695]
MPSHSIIISTVPTQWRYTHSPSSSDPSSARSSAASSTRRWTLDVKGAYHISVCQAGVVVGGTWRDSLVLETYTPVLPKWTAARLRASTHDERFDAPLDGNDIDVMRVVGASCYKLFQWMTYDRMALLNAWDALLLGMLYLAFQASQFIFAEHWFSAD